MATLEDKILGEKKEYYCSSSDEEEDNVSASDEESCSEGKGKERPNEASSTPSRPEKWQGMSTNTGPKGVIKDWQRYKQMQMEQKGDKSVEMIRLAKKLNLTSSQPQPTTDSDEEFLKEWEDQYLEDYRKQRMNEMMHSYRLPTFGQVLHLKGGSEFLDAIDKEDKKVTVVVHIYEENISACKSMNRCLTALSQQYPSVKFCRIVGSSAGMSHRFKVDGVPALLAYKEGQIIGNFVRMTDELGDEFYEGDVENFLVEHGILNDRYCVPELVRDANRVDEEQGGSDWSLE